MKMIVFGERFNIGLKEVKEVIEGSEYNTKDFEKMEEHMI